ncbi:MAG: hypothetical protein F6K22_37555, partial [Okeania sp. SIO2F4]|uniref:hypothetical protein n=1 Tax=Okeania sp. SIO2F4 TaxID=2607790 RepID=UPI00142A6848
ATEKVKTGNKPKTVNLTPPESGSYRIRANFANAEDNITATDILFFPDYKRSSQNQVYLQVR